MTRTISINRAPVLTLWAAVVAERLGFDWEEALTLGRAVAGLNAYAKGVRLGLFTPAPEEVREKRKALRPKETITVDLLHRAVPAVHTKQGLRALAKEKPVDPESVERYLFAKFGDGFDDALGAMQALDGTVDIQGDEGTYEIEARKQPGSTLAQVSASGGIALLDGQSPLLFGQL